MNNSLVSVILSTYNWWKYIKESIESVLNQTHDNLEFIIINDYSTDNVEEIILEFMKNDKRIIYIKNKTNLKLTESLNKWLKKSKWKYIARIDDDDIWINDKLEKQISFMEINREYWLCWTSIIIINSEWKEIHKTYMREKNYEIKDNLLKSNQFTHSSIIIKKSILNKAWWHYCKKWEWVEDYELWLRIWKISKLYNIRECLVKYRWLSNSISRKNQKQQQLNSIKLWFKYKKNYNNFILSFFYKIVFFILIHIFNEKKIKFNLWKFNKKKWKK